MAERRYRTFLSEVDGTPFGEGPQPTYEDAVRKFTTDHLPHIKQSSAERYLSSMDKLAESFAGLKLHQITRAKLSEFETKRRAETKRGGGSVSPATVRRDLTCLSAIMGRCVEWEMIEVNPVPAFLKAGIRRGLKESAPRTRYLSEIEEGKLLDACTPTVMRAAIFAIETGLRSNEQMTLQWDQIDREAGVIRLGTDTKSGRGRAVPLTQRAAQILAQQPRHIRSPLVFCHLRGDASGSRFGDMHHGIVAAAKRAKIPHCTWHDLRRTAGCRWLQRDKKTIDEVSILLGHEDIRTTQRAYAFLDGESIARSLGAGTNPGTVPLDSGPKAQSG